LLFCFIAEGHAFNFSADGKIDIIADKIDYDREKDAVKAKGNVRLSSGDTILTTEDLVYYQKTGLAYTPTAFVLSQGEDEISGESLEYNFKENTGKISSGRIFIKKDNQHIYGDTIEKVGENRFKIKGASFTTCEGEYPSWMVKSSKIDLEIGQYLFADHARLYLKKVPVLYTPKLIVPIKTERQTGLLPPKVGYSSTDGFTYYQPFFWAISRSKDATISLNYEGNRGEGGDVNYRYVRNEQSKGTLDFNYMHESELESDERWRSNFKHSEDFGASLAGRLDLSAVSDRDYFVDYSDNSDLYTSQWLESKGSLLKNWQNYSLLTEFRYFKNLLVDEETTLQKLPELTFSAHRQKLGRTPLYFQAESKLTHFWRREDRPAAGLYSGQRLDVRPSISYPLNPGNFFELTPTLAYRETLYYTSDKEDSSQSRKMYDFKLNFIIPLSRVYTIKGDSVDMAKHTVEPGLEYSYIPDRGQSALPYYDSLDRIARKNSVRFKVNNYLVTKRLDSSDNAVYHKLLDIKVFADYDLHEADRPLISASDKRKPWGPVTGLLKLIGERHFSIESEVRYDRYLHGVSYVSADLRANYKRLENLSLSHRYTRSPEIKYWEAAAKIKLSDSIKIGYLGRYSVVDDLFLESKYGILVEKQCWDIALTYSKREIPEESKFYILFNLKGLGEFGDSAEIF
jgi:LPS-assembly protein